MSSGGSASAAASRKAAASMAAAAALASARSKDQQGQGQQPDQERRPGSYAAGHRMMTTNAKVFLCISSSVICTLPVVTLLWALASGKNDLVSLAAGMGICIVVLAISVFAAVGPLGENELRVPDNASTNMKKTR
ncbi:hypothetical protein PPROV_000810900 [Pycnococcus provasolii]|uniref:Uncharacterized protein n=1 Tax=Pycnococcus provasolii TaxID=41880 RepID=A0A830HQF1_9CHLO|nr:hypothetical protein PPROV_000810900 [Pycnococcus provasolii]